MSTTLLYNMFGIRGYEYRRTDYYQGTASFVVEQPREKHRCSECGSAAVHAHQKDAKNKFDSATKKRLFREERLVS